LLVFSLFGINAISFSEDEQGNSFYEADVEMRVPSMNIKDLFIGDNEKIEMTLNDFFSKLNLFELKVGDVRLLYYFGNNNYIVIVLALIKKRGDLDAGDIKLAEKNRKSHITRFNI